MFDLGNGVMFFHFVHFVPANELRHIQSFASLLSKSYHHKELRTGTKRRNVLKVSDEMSQEIFLLFLNGYPVSEMTERFDIGEETIRKHIRKHKRKHKLKISRNGK